MGYSEKIYEKAQEIIAERHQRAENDLIDRMNKLDAIDEEYRASRKILISTASELLDVIGLPPEQAKKKAAELRDRNLAAQASFGEILKRHNLPADYFEVKYTCPKCEDLGTVGTKLCTCMVELLKHLTIEEESKKSPLKICRFDDFRLDYYPDEPTPVLGNVSPRQRMTEVLDYCKKYCESFDKDSESLLFYGETGLGKTHLSLAIAAEVIERGFSVIYNSAQNLLTKLNNIQFGRLDDPTYEPMLLECDLLVIDDLGAEFQTSFTQTAVYNIINTRINAGLPTIVSTNLSFEEITERYTKRIASRFIGEYTSIFFTGNDIRQLKK